MSRRPPGARAMAGLRVGITATRRSTQLADALDLRGADVVNGPMLSGDVPAPDDVLAADTEVILDADPAWVVATSGVGMRLWLESADRTGHGEALRDLIRRSRRVARGAKAVAGFVGVGVQPEWVSPQETDADVAAWLAGRVRRDQRVAVQLHGGRTHAYRHLRDAGIDVLTVLPYTSGRPDDEAPARELITQLVGGDLDVVTFTSPNAARNLFAIAAEMGRDVHDAVVRELCGPTAVASIGPVTSAALEEHGVVVAICPSRHRTGELLRSIERWAAARPSAGEAPGPVPVHLDAEHRRVVVGTVAVELGPREYEVLATMLRRREAVVRPEEFSIRAWGHDGPADPTQVRNQVSRLRRKLEATPLRIETVRGVGYRLRELTPPTTEAC